MAYRGKGVPQFGWQRTSYDMPAPIRGGRNEVYEVIQDVFTNILEEIIVGDKQLRFVGEYEFAEVPSATIERLLNIYNMKDYMKWAPHKDLPQVNYKVVFVEAPQVIPVNGMIGIDGLKMKIRSVFTIPNIPTLNNLFALSNWPKMCSVTKLSAGSFVVGVEYAIEVPGTTDFTLIGSADNNVGTRFTATGAGTGTGVAYKTEV